jgi:hypothetical protein
MPKFDEAIIQRTQNDITQEIAFLRGVSVGERVFLTLSDGERSNRVMRSLNAAAKQLQVRLARIKSPQTEVIFKVMPVEKRAVFITEEAKAERVAKSRATRSRKTSA